MSLPVHLPADGFYAVAGVALPTQPNIATAPRSRAQQLFGGSTFTLLFENADDATQALLASGSSVALQFALQDGSMVTAQTLLVSTLTGSTFQVDCVLQASQVLDRWVIPSQFP